MTSWKRRLIGLALIFILSACSLGTFLPTPVATPASVDPSSPQDGNPPAQTTLTPLPTLAAPAPAADYLVLIVVDGARPDYFDQAGLPNFRLLTETGTRFAGAWVGAVENNTPPGHTEISTGSFPRRNGIQGHYWLDATARQRIEPTTDEAVQRGEMAAIIDNSGVPTLAGLFKQRFPDEMVAALSTKAYAAQALGAGPSDLIFYSSFFDEDTPPEYVSPELTDLFPLAVAGHEPEDDFLRDPRLNFKITQPGDDNRFVLNMARVLVERSRPRVLLINLPETDSFGHDDSWTPGGSAAIMQNTDQALGELMAAYRAAGIFERTLWVVTADHGMGVKEQVILMDDLANAAGIDAQDRAAFYLPDMRLRDPQRGEPVAERVASVGVDGVSGVYYRTEDGGGYKYAAAQATAAGLPPALNQAYLYLLDTYASPTSANVVVFPKEGVVFDKEPSLQGGTHTAVTWTIQHIPLFLSGPGVARGKVSDAPARLVDLLPTITRLMDLPAGDFDGAVLADALLEPAEADLVSQRDVLGPLVPLRDALRRSAAD